MNFGKMGARGGFGSLGVLGGTGNPARGLLNWQRVARAAKAGTGRGKLIVLSDSTGMGAGSGSSGNTDLVGAYPNGWVPALASRLSSQIPVSFNSLWNNQSTQVAYPTYDTRLTYGANWTENTGALGGNMFKFTAGAVNNLSFTPAGVFDTIILWFARTGSSGSATVNVDGGASLGTVSFTGTNAFISRTLTCSRGTHTINIVPNNDGGLFLSAIETLDSTTPAIDIIQACTYGSVASVYASSANPWLGVPAIQTFAPDLTILALTINDSNMNTGTATYATNMQAIITAAKLSGDVLLGVGAPSNTANATNGVLDSYIAVLQSLVASNGLAPIVNMKSLWGSYANIQSTFPYFDNVHPKQAGYQGPPANGFIDTSTAYDNVLSAAA